MVDLSTLSRRDDPGAQRPARGGAEPQHLHRAARTVRGGVDRRPSRASARRPTSAPRRCPRPSRSSSCCRTSPSPRVPAERRPRGDRSRASSRPAASSASLDLALLHGRAAVNGFDSDRSLPAGRGCIARHRARRTRSSRSAAARRTSSRSTRATPLLERNDEGRDPRMVAANRVLRGETARPTCAPEMGCRRSRRTTSQKRQGQDRPGVRRHRRVERHDGGAGGESPEADTPNARRPSQQRRRWRRRCATRRRERPAADDRRPDGLARLPARRRAQ